MHPPLTKLISAPTTDCLPSSRTEHAAKQHAKDHPLVLPTVELDAEATIRNISPAARRILEYRPDQPIDSSFLAHVHQRHLFRVMQDLAHMVSYYLQRASWLLRLKTGRGRHRWYRAEVQNCLQESAGRIVIVLKTFHHAASAA